MWTQSHCIVIFLSIVCYSRANLGFSDLIHQLTFYILIYDRYLMEVWTQEEIAAITESRATPHVHVSCCGSSDARDTCASAARVTHTSSCLV